MNKVHGLSFCIVLLIAFSFACADQATDPQEETPEQSGKPQAIICEGSDCCILHPGSCGPEDEDDDNEPSVALNCAPHSVVRGELVTCTVTVTPGQPFRITEWTASSGNWDTTLFVDEERGPGEVGTWKGPAVIPTMVSVKVIVEKEGGPNELPPGSDAFTVETRNWDTYQFTAPPKPGGHGTSLPYPPTKLKGDMGEAILQARSLLSAATNAVVIDGPNASWMYARAELPVPVLTAYVNKALDPDDNWALLQRGGAVQGSNGQLFHCSAAEVAALRLDVLAHEGIGADSRGSHYDVWHTYFSQNDFNKALEGQVARFVAGQMTPAHFLRHLEDVYAEYRGQAQSLHDQFDNGFRFSFRPCVWRGLPNEPVR